MTEDEKWFEDYIRYQEEHPDWWGDEKEDLIPRPFLSSVDEVDLDVLRANLKLTPSERLEKMEARLRDLGISRSGGRGALPIDNPDEGD